jgi:enamine deaminase RidA (YjgF/YER057c/UK114 family)
VELGSARHVFACAVPRRGATLAEQAQDALGTIEAVIREEGSSGSIVMQAVFLKDLGDMAACRRIVHDFYGDAVPATTYIFQPHCEGKLLAVEALGVGRGSGEVAIQRPSPQMVIARHDGISWIHLADVRPETTGGGLYDQALAGFRCADGQFARQGFRFDQVVRTWLYLGDIVGSEGQTQRYKELNRARADFYGPLCFGTGRTPPGWQKPVYPASTGIGAEGRDIVMSCIAMATDREDVRLVPLENPRQTSACDYAEQYGPHSPKFSRAMVVAAGQFATTLVSGTASITASQSQNLDDVEGQTGQTLDNIEALLGEANFRRHGLPGLGTGLDGLALVRVYVKRQQDYAKTRAVCQARLGEVPTIYAVADVCRPELLVEIEGIAFSRQR